MDIDFIRINHGSIPTFDGSIDKYTMWWTKFRAFAMLNGFGDAIQDEPDPDLPDKWNDVIDASTESGKKQLTAKKKNDITISSFTMAFTREGIMRMVSKAKTKEWPEGVAYLIVKELKRKYRPNDIISKVELRQRLNQVSMKKGSDPSILFETLAAIEDQYDGIGAVSETDLIAIVLDVATDEYQAVLTGEQRAKGDDLSLNDLELIMRQHYRQINRSKTNRRSDVGEVLLTASGTKQPYKLKQGQTEKNNENDSQKRIDRKCLNCGKKGHFAANCWYKESNKDKRPPGFRMKSTKTNTEEAAIAADTDLQEYLLGLSDQVCVENDPNIWIADTAATVHMTPHRIGMTNVRKIENGDVITMGNGTQERVQEIADIEGIVCNKNKKRKVRIQDVTILKNGRFNLFSISQMLKKGWRLTGNAEYIAIQKDDYEMVFDQKIVTKRGVLYATQIDRSSEICANISDNNLPKPVKMTTQEAHEKLGHISFQATAQTANQLGWELTKSDATCEACAIGKARQKNIIVKPKKATNFENSGRIHLDISSIINTEYAEFERTPKPYWRIIVDERTQLKFSDFHTTKSGMVEPTCELIQSWKNSGKSIKYIRCDDGGENKALEKRLKSSDWKINIKFEYTGRDTPQRNSLAEVAFYVIANRGRAIMNAANVPRHFRYILWREAFQTATYLDGLIIMEIDGVKQTRYEHWGASTPKYSKCLRIWGEAGIVKLTKRGDSKIDDRGKICMFVGYSSLHACDTYRMWDPNSYRVHLTRDIRWLKRMFFKQPDSLQLELPHGNVLNRTTITEIEKTDTSDDDESNGGNSNNDSVGEKNVVPFEDDDKGSEEEELYGAQNITRTTRSGRIIRQPAKYREFVDVLTDDTDELMLIGMGNGNQIPTDELHVKSFKAAMQSDDKDKWMIAVEEEHDRMIQNNVWTAINKHTLGKHEKVLTTTWAMKKKPNCKFRARINARGYEQVDGIHYDSSSIAAPVTNDVTIRIMYTLATLANWKAYVVDVQGAFLNGHFQEEETLYLKIPEGFEDKYDKNSQVLKLNRTIYGLKQAATAFWSALLKALTAMGYVRSKGDPCCYFKIVDNRIMMCLSWVDDCLFLGTEDDVISSKTELMKHFNCDDNGFSDEYVGCKIEMCSGNKMTKFTQPVLIRSLIEEFNSGKKKVSTPAAPGQTLQAGKTEDEVDIHEKKRYQAGVGKLLYLTRWSRPEIGNSVRELSRFAARPQLIHVVAMQRVMDYCVDGVDIGWTLKPNGEWKGKTNDNPVHVVGFSDSDYAKDIETRRSVTGYSVFLNGAPVATKSKMQTGVTLSVTEAELVSATQCVQEMIYVKKILESVGVNVKLPMKLMIDNKGAKDLINNWSVGGRTRHIDVRYFFLREMKEKNIVKIEWIKSENNPSDLFTKNLNNQLFKKHSEVFIGK
jgi:Reverse transcriptase (RNA-dependent DNA polymerase)